MTIPKDVIGRLGASDTVGLAAMGVGATADADQVAAMSRIIRDLNVPIMRAKYVYADLLRQMQNAPLTINFEAYKFFNKKPDGDRYVSQFEGGNTWGDPNYMTSRDEAEEAMFDYSATKAKVGAAPLAVQQRVKDVGARSEPEFTGAIRPKYSALNYAGLKYGSAAQWGKSHMVLKEHLKHNATFIHTDSFDVAGSARQRAMLAGQLATFLNMQRLLVNMGLPMLQALEKATKGIKFGDAVQPPGVGTTAYIEAHMHAEVRFDRDLAKLVICQDELDQADVKTQVLHNKDKKRWKAITPKKLKATLEKFTSTYGIGLEYV
jgi:hypothetical protein